MKLLKCLASIIFLITCFSRPSFAEKINDFRIYINAGNLENSLEARFILRPLTYRDLEPVYQYYSKDITFAKNYALSKHEIKRWLLQSIDSSDQISIAIEDVQEKIPVGFITYREIESKCPAISYTLALQYQGLGLMTKAVRASLSLAFSVDSVELVRGVARTANLGSLRVLQKCGLKEVSHDDLRTTLELPRRVWLEVQNSVEFNR